MAREIRLTSRGRITIPKDIRDGIKARSGGRITFTLMPDNTITLNVKRSDGDPSAHTERVDE